MEICWHKNIQMFIQTLLASHASQDPTYSLILGLALKQTTAETNEAVLLTIHQKDSLATAFMSGHQLLVESPAELAPVLADEIHKKNIAVPAVHVNKEAALPFVERWAARSNAAYRLNMSERLYVLHQVQPTPNAPGIFRKAEQKDIDPLTQWLYEFNREAMPEFSKTLEEVRKAIVESIGAGSRYVWDDGGLVSMAAQTRSTPESASVNAVYTPPELRARGYATACVAALSQAILDSGKSYCCLFTDLANPTSNSIYCKIGYSPVCDYEIYELF